MTGKKPKNEAKKEAVPEAVAETPATAPQPPKPEPEKDVDSLGRPTKLTEEVRLKMEQACALDASVKEICFYAGISKQTYYNWKEEYPDFFDHLDALRAKPFLKARQTVVNSLEDPQNAFRYLEKKGGNEFNPAHKIEVTPPGENTDENDPAVKKAIGVFEEAMRPVLTTPKVEKKETPQPTPQPQVA